MDHGWLVLENLDSRLPLNRVPGLDFTGATTGAHPVVTAATYLALTLLLLGTAYAGRVRQARLG